MSMAVLTPIFPYLSALIGATLGLVIGSWFALLFTSLRHRNFPVDQATELFIRPILFSIPPIAGYFCTRFFFGLPEFNPHESIIHFIQEIMIQRAAWFFAAAFIGLVSTLLIFVSAIFRKSSRTRDSALFRGAASAWEA
ncbi:hypothetical protein [Rhodoplanes roseus]|uniref:hypothetical protein n=1 Tax=Rhodoplanes roseus TaxID=29409 RepID=UPI0011B46790|nr:hypothetical protein [Rhodoplanes roseus]